MKLFEIFLPRDKPIEQETLELYDQDLLFEMANLREESTGFPGVIFVSTQMGNHGPRVKYYVQTGNGQKIFSVSIEENLRVVANSMTTSDMNYYSKYVIEFVRANWQPLLYYWYNGTDMNPKQTAEFFEKIVPV